MSLPIESPCVEIQPLINRRFSRKVPTGTRPNGPKIFEVVAMQNAMRSMKRKYSTFPQKKMSGFHNKIFRKPVHTLGMKTRIARCQKTKLMLFYFGYRGVMEPDQPIPARPSGGSSA
jgi:hypothetical protein